jgi:peptide/nickel transport system permease protein
MVSPIQNGVFLSVDFKSVVRDAIAQKLNKFTFTDEAGVTSDYTMDLVHKTYNIKTLTVSRLITMYEAPSSTHFMGTDANGMDVLIRLMYGGRVSLMVGFVVVFLELFIGVIVGGISGYFGGWVDMVCMRFVDLFNSIPFYPVVFILGAAMDSMNVEATGRIFLLMAVLGIMGWTGIARVVRGQILSLREQDFMVATEATGIRNSRRIFRHLVPNVMPLLIVQATMNLGGIIITEATLSFLGLGVKYPLASWGSIINAANSIHVLRNYGFIWIPAGILFVLTVLGFNFVGDGLRDAFDPKMKR